MKIESFFAEAEQNGVRTDVFLSEKTGLTRSRIKRLADDGKIAVNGVVVPAKKPLKTGDSVRLEIPDNRPLDLEPRDIPVDIVYQDDDLAVIDKPQGLTVHAGSGTDGDTLVNALLFRLDRLSGINGTLRPGIVHRIDKNTSGLLVVAKNDRAHLSLSEQIAEKTCRRVYVALLEGVVKQEEGTIETYLSRSDRDRTKMAVSAHGRRAVTHYRVLRRYAQYTLCEFRLETGRTHQIRVHAKYVGHPVVGDPEYGYKNQKFKLNGQLLHAKELSFQHPTTGKQMTFTAPLPDYFQEVLKKLSETERQSY